jgi:hypothetical protein
MPYKFIQCKNPAQKHIKLVFGELLNTWEQAKCDCGYPFEFITDQYMDFEHLEKIFEDVSSEEDTKEYPAIK